MRAERDRQQVRLGAGVGEAHALQPEALAHRAGEPRLDQVGAAEIDPGVQRAIHRGADHRMRVAIDAGGIFAEEVDVFGAVEVPQPAALAARDAERKRRVVQHGARVAAGHHRGRFDDSGRNSSDCARRRLPSPRSAPRRCRRCASPSRSWRPPPAERQSASPAHGSVRTECTGSPLR